MLTLPRWLMVGGFLAGYIVLCGIFTLKDGVDVSASIVGFVWYTATFGVSLLIPWVLLPVITNQSRRSRRILIAILAGLLPAAFALSVTTYLYTGWDAPPLMLVAISLSVALCHLPTFAALAYTVARGTRSFQYEMTKSYPLYAGIICVVAPLVVSVCSAPIMVLGGWVTRTESPNAEQVTHAREFLLIDPSLEIEPVAYYRKTGMDDMVRFKFIARTDNPTKIFDPIHIDPSTFRDDFKFQPGEETHNESWWDISARSLTGGRYHAPGGPAHLEVGFAKNNDSTITTYVWRHE